MDSQLASVLTSGSLEVQNGSQHGEASGPVTEDVLDPKDKTSPRTKPGNLKSCAVKAAGTIRQDAQSINGKKPEVGGTSKPAFQEVRDIGGLKQPITVKTGVPVLHRQPIRIKIVVPPGCKRPITNSATSPTKDCAASYMKGPVLVSVGALIPETNSCHTQISAAKNEEVREETSEKTDEETDAKSFQDTEAEGRDRKVWDVKITHRDASETHFLSDAHAVHVSSHQRVKEETTDREIEQNIPQTLPEVKLKFHKTFCEVEAEEQTEPLDLSFPKKSRERSSGRFLGDPGCESPLIMEVDEYEGDGDRDLVEEDSDENSGLRLSGIDLLEESLLSPSFFSTSVLASLSSEDCDTEDLLLIDDQGIPYTLSPDGLKVPQVNASAPETPQSDQGNSAEQEVTLSSHLATLAGVSQSLDHALAAPCGEFDPSSVPAGDLSLKGGDQITTPEIFPCLMTNTDPSELNIKAAQEANVVLSPSSGLSLPAQPFQILTNPPTNAPILLLSASSSAPAGLSLPLSVTQTSPGASTPVLLLLSPVSSSPDDSTSTSTPIAVLDPSTGQLSQITSASAPFSLPLSSGQVSVLGSSRPTIRLSPSSSLLIRSGLNNVTSGPALTSLAVPSSTFALQDNHLSTATLIQTQISYSESNPGTEAISVEESENKKPSTFATTSSQTQTVTYDTLTLPTSEAEAQSPASESRLDFSDVHSEHLPLDDHLYFSNSAAPPSPPIGPLLPSGKLDSLEALEPLSPAESPTSLGSRRVLCCHLCPRIFFYLSDLERHAITHSQKKPHVCQQCGKAFKRSSHLQRHKHIHTGQRNFVCPICSKRFREAGELQRHQRVHTGEKPYQCQLCHTRFAERNTLRRHTKRKHPYHQVAMEMLNERKDRGGARGDGGDGGRGGVPEEESAEWYSSTVSTLDNSESETET